MSLPSHRLARFVTFCFAAGTGAINPAAKLTTIVAIFGGVGVLITRGGYHDARSLLQIAKAGRVAKGD